MSKFWKGRTVVVTGGSGFVGQHVCKLLTEKEAKVIIADSRLPSGGLRKVYEGIRHVNLCSEYDAMTAVGGADTVIHMAGTVAGIQVNSVENFWMFRKNMNLASNVLWACRESKVPHVLYVSTACVYPDSRDGGAMMEHSGHLGEVALGNVGAGWAKRMGERMARWLCEETNTAVQIVRPFNTYGPGDNFDPDSSHVIPSLIAKVEKAKKVLKVWGSPLTIRSFIYVKDLAEGVVLAAEKGRGNGTALNLGRSEPVSIEKLAQTICKVMGRTDLKIEFERDKPTGTHLRVPNTELARSILGFKAETSLEEGLRETVAWRKANALQEVAA